MSKIENLRVMIKDAIRFGRTGMFDHDLEQIGSDLGVEKASYDTTALGNNTYVARIKREFLASRQYDHVIKHYESMSKEDRRKLGQKINRLRVY